MRGSPKRFHTNKSRSASKFRSQSSRTKGPNVRPGPMRGGIRF